MTSPCDNVRAARTPHGAPPSHAKNDRADHRQPIDIESLLIWTFARQRADAVTDRAFEQETAWLRGGAADSVARMQRVATYGGFVDGGGPSASAVHEDAAVVFRAVERLARDKAGLIYHARTMGRPDWLAGVVARPVPVLDARGRPARRYEAWDTHRNWGWCPVDWPVTESRIAAAREAYARWHADLLLLRHCRDLARLEIWRVTGPKAAATPWA